MTTQELWQSQTLDSPRITTAYLRGRADDSTRRVRQWNVVEYGSSVFAVIVAIVLAVSSTNVWMLTGAGLLVVSSVVYAWGWRRVATPVATPGDLGALDTLRFHRRELERQRSAYRGQLRWVVPLFLPPVMTIMYGVTDGGAKLGLAIFAGLLGLAMGVLSSEIRAAKLKREIELLDLMAR
jgi:hypothetical protein